MSLPPTAGDIHQAVVNLADAGRKFAVAMILKDTGHTPRKAGTKALIDAGGAITGTIGGGAVEAEAQRRAVEAIRAGRPVVFDFALEGASPKDDRPICGGNMRILVDPTAAGQRAAYAQATEALRERRRGVLVTTVRLAATVETTIRWFAEGFSAPGRSPLPLGERVAEGRVRGAPCQQLPLTPAPSPTVGRGENGGLLNTPAATDMGFPGAEAIRETLASDTPKLFVQDLPAQGVRLEVLVEPLTLPPLVVIAGGGHIGQALAVQAGQVGFQVVVIDDRPEFTDAALYPEGVATRCGDIARELADFPVAADTYVVIVTRGHQQDQQALAACLHRSAAYIGMIGSRRKVAMIRKDLLESRTAGEEELARLYAPIGLDIGAETVPEIATSIVAQLIAVRRKGSSPRMPLV